MKIGEFIKKVGTTKDTVRYYEEMKILHPKWENHRRIYGLKEVEDFQIIKEMQTLGLTIKDAQAIFTLKTSSGCGNPDLIQGAIDKLELKQQELTDNMETIKHQQNDIATLLTAIEAYQTTKS